jgi:putative addiction module CopG family antidote
MDISLTDALREFVQAKVQSGEFSSEGAVVEAALRRLQDREPSALASLIDHEFVEFCDREGDERVTLVEVLQATSGIPGSLAESIIEDERADRF